ncbi:protein phosphatase methylesterase 1 [Teratosphaeria nubilosa]|uniref:Protein phosphatase methylesterase 1 n=1 Tax=Teratosphaeria nubilosa TaxID=161662 RepID=A0A6G1KT03_9PEZI|nr:protein phosphatase methylesterase 1 [Teratosphaeria nubilosa]
MSDLLRQSVDGTPAPPPRPKPNPIPVSEVDEHSSSDSSASSADSLASVNTVRPSSREQEAPPTHWTSYFAQELWLQQDSDEQRAKYHVYLTPPADLEKGPLFICHHGAGSAGLSFAVFAQGVRQKLPEAGVLALEARGHGSIITNSTTGEEIVDFSLQTLASDAVTMINLTRAKLEWTQLPPSVLVGHSLGGAIVTQMAADYALGSQLIGFSVIDVVEGSAVEALQHMRSYLSSRPSIFASIDEAVTWHLRSRTLRNPESAKASVPALFSPLPSGKYVWKTDLNTTVKWWEDWFTGMSQKFLKGRGAKQLILAGTDRLDKELMIGQMQGRFQLVVIPEAGHFVQEDVPEKTAGLLVEFFKRNDRSASVLPPKVSELIAMGKEV